MIELVFVQDLSISAEPFTTDEVIAAYSGNSIHAVRQSIRTNKVDISDFGVLAYKMLKPIKGSKGIRLEHFEKVGYYIQPLPSDQKGGLIYGKAENVFY